MQDLIDWNNREAAEADAKADELLARARDGRCSAHTRAEYMRRVGECRGAATRLRENARALQLTLSKVDKLIDGLNDDARGFGTSGRFGYGLPTHIDKQMKIMRETVCRILQEG